MPYVNFTNIDNDLCKESWQLRIHINPGVLEQSKDNQIQVIESILKEVFGKEQAGIKLFSIADEDKNGKYDGALSHSGKDRTQVGKEINIYLPDSTVSQLTTEQYKTKLLLLWKKLQQNNVPLMYMNLPGDQSISVANSLPSPFSFTSNNPDKTEWHETHGILLKKFTPNGNHPILNVDFSLKDINQHKIKLDSDELQRTIDYLSIHKKEVYKDIEQQIELIRNQEVSYQEVLFDYKKSIGFLNSLIKRYADEVDSIIDDPKKRGDAQLVFNAELVSNKDYQFLINASPHESDQEFTSKMLTIRFNNFTEEKAKQYILSLRVQFNERVDDITKDFQSLEGELPFEKEKLVDLITKNPAQMQSIYRQLALIKQEESLNKNQHPAIVLLTAYKNNREKITSNEYFSFFGGASRAFGAYSKKEKFEAVDELIKSINDSNYKLDKRHLGPLSQGQLKLIVKEANINLDDYIDKTFGLTNTKT